VGSAQALKQLSVSGTSALNGGAVTTMGGQTYIGAATLGTDDTLTGSVVAFAGTADATAAGAQGLAVQGNAAFGSTVGSAQALKQLSVSGTSALNGGAVTTMGGQTYMGAATLGVDDTLTSDGSDLSFHSTVDGNHALNMAAGQGNVSLAGAVGGVMPPTSLTITNAMNVSGAAITAGVITQMKGGGLSQFTGLLHALGTGGLNLSGKNFSISGGITVEQGPALLTSRKGKLNVFSGPVSLMNGEPLMVSDQGTADSISSAITGLNSMVSKSDTGTLMLTADNSYGPTSIAAGTLQIGNGGTSGSLGTGDVFDSATLHFLRGDRITVPNAIHNGGQVIVSNGIVVTTSLNSDYTGPTMVESTLLAKGKQPLSPVMVMSGAELAGDGVVGSVEVSAQGHLAPGADLGSDATVSRVGALQTTGGVTVDPGASLDLRVEDLRGTSSEVVAGGPVSVSQMTLALSSPNPNVFAQNGMGGNKPSEDARLVAIANALGLPIQGQIGAITFNGSPVRTPRGSTADGTVFPLAGACALITYSENNNSLQVADLGSDHLYMLGLFRALYGQSNATPATVQGYLDLLSGANPIRGRLRVASLLWNDLLPDGRGPVTSHPNATRLALAFHQAFPSIPMGRFLHALERPGGLENSSAVLMHLLLRNYGGKTNTEFVRLVLAGFRKSLAGVLGGVNGFEWVARLQAGSSRQSVLDAILTSKEVKTFAIRDMAKLLEVNLSVPDLLPGLNIGKAGSALAGTNADFFAASALGPVLLNGEPASHLITHLVDVCTKLQWNEPTAAALQLAPSR
jgi:autotransporter-associated beta strand protein